MLNSTTHSFTAASCCSAALRVIKQLTPEEKRSLRAELAAADIAVRPAPDAAMYEVVLEAIAHGGPVISRDGKIRLSSVPTIW